MRPAWGRNVLRILRVQAHLDRVPFDLAPVRCKRLAFCDAELLVDEVEARDRLRDRVLDLDPAVELEEEEVVAVDDELDRAGALGSRSHDRRRRPRRAVASRSAGTEAGSGGLLEDLLVPALHRAVTLAERDDVAVRVGEELYLDMAGPFEVALAVERPVAEGALRLALGGGQRVVELVRRRGRPASRDRRRRPRP